MNDLFRSKNDVISILDTLPTGMFIVDGEGTILSINQEIERLFGYPKVELIGRSIEILIPSENHEKHRVDRGNYFKNPEPRKMGEGRHLFAVAKNGEKIPVEIGLHPWIHDDISYIIGSVVDLTYQKKHEEEILQLAEDLKASNLELESFAYVVSHDLQEPLRMIMNYLKLLERRYGRQLDDEATEFIGFAVDGASRLQGMIEDLLKYARVTTRGGEFQQIDLQTVLDDVLRDLQFAIKDNKATITIDNLPTISADKTQMRQLLQNLIGNAIKYHGEADPIIKIGATEDVNSWRISVSDNGIGIDPKYFDQIFVVFKRLHHRGEYEGNGIGLSVCKRIVERHGGKLHVESAVGKGSTFIFSIPKNDLIK